MGIMFKLFSTYGVLIIFIVIALEHMNFPGLPAGLIMPGIGALAANGSISLLEAMLICLIDGVASTIGITVYNAVLITGGYVVASSVI